MSLWRSRWAAIGAAVAVTLGAGGLGLIEAVDSGEKPVTVTIIPRRIVDTRIDLGMTRVWNQSPKLMQVTGTVPVAAALGTEAATVVPSDAIGVLVNVTVVNPDSAGFLSLRPFGATGFPTTSTVNFTTVGAIEPNAATVDLGPGGKVEVWLSTADSGGSADVLVDVLGYTVDHTHDDRYYTQAEVDGLVPAARPFAVSARGADTVITSDPQNLIVLPIDEPAAGGSFTVNYSITLEQDEPGAIVECALDNLLMSVAQRWESPGNPGGVTQMSGTGSWDYVSGEPDNSVVVLSCHHSGSAVPTVASNASMTAVFTPTR